MYYGDQSNFYVPDRYANKKNGLHYDPTQVANSLAAGNGYTQPGVPQTPMPQTGPTFNWETGMLGGGTQGAAQAQTQQDVNAFNNQGRPNQGNGPGGQQNQRNNTPTPANWDPNDSTSSLVNGSDQWYGKLNDYGVQTALGSPQGFWGSYGSNVQGWNPTGNASAFMANLYNDPQGLVAALNPSANGPWGNERTLAGETGLANQLSGDYANFFDVGQIMSGVFHAIATNDDQALGNINPMLATMIQQNKGNPAGQVKSIVDFLGNILPSMMPQDMAQALVTQIQAVGNQWAMSLGQGGPGSMKNLDVANFAQYLMQTMGPALGIS